MSARWTVEDIPSQEGRTFVVTGATSGLGLESATALARSGARVLMAARNAEKAERARTDVAAVATGPEPEVVALDLADLGSVREAAAAIAERAPTLDVLMNNAGVMALPHATTADGFEMQLGTNHLGHFALTGLLLPTLLAGGTDGAGARVVTTSSGAHKGGRMRWDDLQGEKRYQRWMAYGQSKLANLLFAYELDRRGRAAKAPLASIAAHPGYASTHLQAAGPEMKGSKVGVRLWDTFNRLAQSAADGALPQLYAATMPDVRGGEYLGPAGLFEMRGAPTRVDSTKRSHSQEDATRLWDASERLTGVTFTW
jgi:NAD(P)-dependent dehydrogenase (short-subunit alcohol dehydrogenase family)